MKSKFEISKKDPSSGTHFSKDPRSRPFERAPLQKKGLSQVFLKTTEPLKKVSSTLRSLGIKQVLEIGPGGGILTEELVKSGFRVTAIETDERFVEHLAVLFSTINAPSGASLDLVHKDFLKYPVDEWLQSTPEVKALVGNIPYHISSPILLRILAQTHPSLGAVILMTQKEFADRLVASPGSKDYGSLSVFAQLRMKVSLLEIVPRHLFSPVPKVDSALFLAVPWETPFPSEELQMVEKITRLAFAQRRKKLHNALSGYPGFKNLPLESSPLDLSLRADAVSPQAYYDFAMWVNQHQRDHKIP